MKETHFILCLFYLNFDICVLFCFAKIICKNLSWEGISDRVNYFWYNFILSRKKSKCVSFEGSILDVPPPPELGLWWKPAPRLPWCTWLSMKWSTITRSNKIEFNPQHNILLNLRILFRCIETTIKMMIVLKRMNNLSDITSLYRPRLVWL